MKVELKRRAAKKSELYRIPEDSRRWLYPIVEGRDILPFIVGHSCLYGQLREVTGSRGLSKSLNHSSLPLSLVRLSALGVMWGL